MRRGDVRRNVVPHPHSWNLCCMRCLREGCVISIGEVAERTIAPALKAGGPSGPGGSNPSLPAMSINDIVETILFERYDHGSNEEMRSVSRRMVHEIVERGIELWMGGREADCIRLESGGPPETGTVGSNPTPSAKRGRGQ